MRKQENIVNEAKSVAIVTGSSVGIGLQTENHEDLTHMQLFAI